MNSIDYAIYNNQVNKIIKTEFKSHADAATHFGVSVNTLRRFLKSPSNGSHMLKIKILDLVNNSNCLLILDSELYIKTQINNSVSLINHRFTFLNDYIIALKEYCEVHHIDDYLLALEIIHSANLYQETGKIVYLEEVANELRKCRKKEMVPILIRTVFHGLQFLFVKLAYVYQVKDKNSNNLRALKSIISSSKYTDDYSLKLMLDNLQETYDQWIDVYQTLTSDDCFIYYNKLGSAYFIGKAYSSALNAYQQSSKYISTDDNELYNLMNQSICYFEMGSFDVAFNILSQLLERLPYDHYHRNTVYLNAWEMITKKLDPNLALAYFREIDFNEYINKGVGIYHITEVLFENTSHNHWDKELSHYFALLFALDSKGELSKKKIYWLIDFLNSNTEELKKSNLLDVLQNIILHASPDCNLKNKIQYLLANT